MENHQSSDKIDDNLLIVVGFNCQKFRTKKKILQLITAKENACAGTRRKTRPWRWWLPPQACASECIFLAGTSGRCCCLPWRRGGPPLESDVVKQDPHVLEGPDIAGQLGVLSLHWVLEVCFVVSVSGLPVQRSDSHIFHQGLELELYIYIYRKCPFWTDHPQVW